MATVLSKSPLEKTFQGFLDQLKIRNPRELILVNPHLVPEAFFDLSTARRGGYYAYPPMGLVYIAAVAKQVNPTIDVTILDLNFELLRHSKSEKFSYRYWRDLLVQTLEECDAPHIGISYMFGTTRPCFTEVSGFIRQNFPDVPVLTGGVQASYDYKELLESGLSDIVFRKEGEMPFKAFLESCMAGQTVDLPQGACFNLNGNYHELGDPPNEAPIDWDIRSVYPLIKIEEYHKFGSLGAFSKYNGEEKRFATVLGNRGCRARCTFCTVRDFNGFGVRQRTVESVIDEIKYLVRERGINQIDWLDDDLLWNPERAVALFKGLAAEVPELEWLCSNGLIAVAISEEIMEWMVKSGMKAFKIGIESGNDEMLHAIKKPTTKPKLRQKKELFKKYPEVLVSANFIIGFPKETFGQMMDTYNFARELDFDWSSFYICQPLKGTEMFSAFQELGDDRCEEERYDKTLNPGRSAARGEFGYLFQDSKDAIRRGKDVFNLPPDTVPNNEQLKEIWFTFNLVANFLNNPNFAPGGNPEKIVKWLEAIHSGYPYDASMSAALVRGYRLLNNEKKAALYREKFNGLVAHSVYWQRRVHEFPELALLAESPRMESLPKSA